MANVTVTTTPVVSPGPTTTHYQQLASELSGAIDQIGTVVPPLDEAEFAVAKLTRGQLGVSEQFCATVLASVEQFPRLRGNGDFDPVEARDTLQFLQAFRPVRDRVETFRRTVKFRFDSRKAGLVKKCLQVYHFTKRLARDSGDPELLAVVENMARDLGRRGLLTKKVLERRAAKQAAAAAAPAPEKEVPPSKQAV